MSKVTREYLLAIAPGAKPEIVDGIVAAQALLTEYGIVNDKQTDYFFGQVAEETGGFTQLEENLFYTSTDRLMQVWPSRFKTAADALPYVRQPQKLANLVYNGRMGNRMGSNDGWMNRGSGDLMTTGFVNYELLPTSLNAIVNPDVIRSHPGALEAACFFWSHARLNKFADAGDIVGLTQAINGGQTGVANRRLYTDRALRARMALPLPVNTYDWLKQGDKRSDLVKDWQTTLQKLGYYKGGVIDGVFGAGTDDATRHFQTDKGLTVDGVVGPATLAAGRAAVPSPVDPHSNPVNGPGTAPAPVPASNIGLGALIAAALKLIFAAIFRKG